MTVFRLVGLGLAALLLAGAAYVFVMPATHKTASKTPSDQTAVTEDVRDLSWDDLLPEGEHERIEAIYTAFYEDLQARMMAQAQTAGPGLLSGATTSGGEEDTPAYSNDPDGTDELPGDDSFLMAIAEGSSADTMPQLGTFNVVSALNGVLGRLPGYIVPLEFSKDDIYTEFLLVPYFGACLHSPPPPPNQIVYVKTEDSVTIPDIWEPYWIEGRVETARHENETGNAAYTLHLTTLRKYET